MKRLWLYLAVLVMLITVASAQEIRISAEVVENTVIADVIFEGNPGIAGFSVNMGFDNKMLVPVSIEVGQALKGHSITSNLHIVDDFESLDYVSAVWTNYGNFKGNGVFYTVIFDIKEGAKGDTQLTIGYRNGDIANALLQNVDFDLSGQIINISSEKPSVSPDNPPEAPTEPDDEQQETFVPSKVYADVYENDWYFADVSYVYQKGLMTGIQTEPELLFAPLLHTNRAMFVTVLYRIEGQPDAKPSGFTDIEQGSYYEKAVNWAAENGIINGMSPTEFAPLNNITREQAAKIIANYCSYKKIKEPTSTTDIKTFSDYSDVNSWATQALQLCSDMGIIRGRDNNTIDPQGNTTRAETAAILRRLTEYINKNK